MLGAAIITINIQQDGKNHGMIFSGDIGEPGRPIVGDATLFDEAKYIVIESIWRGILKKCGNS